MLKLSEVIVFFNLEPKVGHLDGRNSIERDSGDIVQDSDLETPLKENRLIYNRSFKRSVGKTETGNHNKAKLGEKRKRQEMETVSEAQVVCQSLQEELMIMKRCYIKEKELRESLERMVAIQHSNASLSRRLITSVCKTAMI